MQNKNRDIKIFIVLLIIFAVRSVQAGEVKKSAYETTAAKEKIDTSFVNVVDFKNGRFSSDIELAIDYKDGCADRGKYQKKLDIPAAVCLVYNELGDIGVDKPERYGQYAKPQDNGFELPVFIQIFIESCPAVYSHHALRAFPSMSPGTFTPMLSRTVGAKS